ncbi:Do family serine endopeptidase [Aestuariivirga litoralis]|uniref:Do family serine endopeptidase n=1 Tax=Aestuariivirga litoralis TaxID=2650924 RepID=UPI0018C4B9E5|nr:Do family serine endopeptidase [Aestuariivirga litoralis]MBG1231435.1 Do family serine endopeptidase [Aestuariivirga litoralis]
MRFLSGLVLAVVLGTGTGFADTVPTDKMQMQLSFAPLVKKTAPAVVNVYAKTIQRVQGAGGPFDDPFFQQFFGRGQPRERVGNSLGSGVIVDKSGIIVTNNHVITGATDIRVALADKREFPAKLLLADEKTDLAVLRIDVGDEKLPILPFGNSDSLEVGDLVLAIGNPFGVGQTVTNGIVSALARTDVGASNYQSFIQTDAAINPGNSGGALVNMKGELVGINSMIYSRSGGSVGLGFSIPANLVSTVVQSAESGKKIVRPWMGGTFQVVNQDIADALGLDRPEGVLINNLDQLSPLREAGLQQGDVIMAMDGKSLENPQELNYLLGISHIGDSKLMEYRRGTTTKQVQIKLIAAPESVERQETSITGKNPLSGAVVVNLSPAVADELGMDTSAKGVVISGLQNGPARQFFIKGDIILEMNGAAIDTVDTLQRVVAQPSRGWVIGLLRGGQKVYFRLG